MTRLAPVLVAAAVTLAACGSSDEQGSPAAPVDTAQPTTPGEPFPTDTEPPSLPTQPPTPPATQPPTTDRPADELQYDPVELRARLAQARQNWADFDTPSYRYRYSPTCFCAQELLEAHVIDGKLINDTGHALLHSIEEWFDIIDESIGTAYDIRVEFDDWGYPNSLYIDVDEMIADEEFGLSFDGYAHVPDAVGKFMADHYGCGYGFTAASPNQSVSFQVSFPSEPAPGTFAVADVDFAEVRFGADLMANWCDDVVEVDEPEPRIDERWTVTGGTLTITIDGQQATGEFRDLVATTADAREYPLGNVDIVNNAWGVFAG